MHAPTVHSGASPGRLPQQLFHFLLWLCVFLPAAATAQRMPQDTWYLAREVRGQIEPDALAKPSSAAFGPDGNLYVLENEGKRVHVFDADGRSLRTWGGFTDPVGIAITTKGEVYVADNHSYYSNKITIFDLQGNVRRSFNTLQGKGFLLDASLNVYVFARSSFDGSMKNVFVYDPEGKSERLFYTAPSAASGAAIHDEIKSICRTSSNTIAVLHRGYSFTNYTSGSYINVPPSVKIFSTDGTKVSEFNVSGSVTELNVDNSDNFHVCLADGVVAVYSPSGTKLREFGSGGSGTGQLSNPTATVTKDGKVYVCDSGNSRIAVFDNNGSWVKNFGTYGIGEFFDLRSVVVDKEGNIYTGDYEQKDIRKYDASLNFVKRIGRGGSGDGEFSGLLGLAVSPDQKLYALDESSRIQIFDLEGNFIGKFGTGGNSDGAFNAASGIAVGPDGRVYVSDRDNHRIQVFAPDGRFLSKFGSQGSFNGQFNKPLRVAVSPSGMVAVADSENYRNQFFDSEGTFVRLFDSNGNASYKPLMPQIVSFLSDGNLSVFDRHTWDYRTGSLRIFDQSGAVVKSWAVSSCSAIGELRSGDMITAHQDQMLRIWKRTYRVVVPEPGNALPLPRIVSQGRRPGTSLVDVDYTVKDADNVTVQTAALAFKNGGNSLADVIPISSFAEGSGSKLGANTATGQVHRFTWDVTKDWATDFGEVQLEVLAKDGRGLFNLDFIQIPAAEGNAVLKISRSPLTDVDFLSVWYWLVATGDPGIQLSNGVVNPATLTSTLAYDGSNGVPGLTGVYYANNNFEGTPVTRVDQTVNIRPASSAQSLDGPFQSEQLSVKWNGVLVPSETGRHQLFFNGDDSFSVWVNDQVAVSRSWNGESMAEVDLTANTPVPIRIEYRDYGWQRVAQLSWQPPGKTKEIIPPTNLFTGVLAPAGSVSYTRPGQEYAFGTTTTAAGRAYLFQKMGLREATPAEVTRAKEAGTPGVINRWAPKLQVGPGERPAAINSYGFDTGAEGYWVVPITN
jgi:sugar lactone lactonase YvrE